MKKGFTLVEIMIVVAIIGLLAAIAIPSFMRARSRSQQSACINNLRMIDAAKEQYAMEWGMTNGQAFADNAVLVGRVDGYIRDWPLCPASTTVTNDQTSSEADYTYGVVGANPVCRIMGGDPNFPHAIQAFDR